MRLEAVRIVADWLLNASYGVNHYVPLVPRDAGDPVPPLIAAWADPNNRDQVQPLAIFDETRHEWAANRLAEPPATPCLSIYSQGRILVAGEATPDGQIRRTVSPIQVAIRYLTKGADLAPAVRDGDYVMRAVARSLRELSKNGNEESRKRNGILIELGEDPMEHYPVVEAVGEYSVVGALVVNYRARDYAPSF